MLFGSVQFRVWITAQTILVGVLAMIIYAFFGTIGLLFFSALGIITCAVTAAVILVIPIPKTYMYAWLFAAWAFALSVVPIAAIESGALIILLALVFFLYFNQKVKPYGLERGWQTPMWLETKSES